MKVMDELKLILESCAQLGEGARQAFIWWCAKELIIYSLGWCGGLLMIWMVCSKITHLVKACNFERRMAEVYAGTDALTDSERSEILFTVKTYFREKRK